MAKAPAKRRVVRRNPHRKEPVPYAATFGARVKRLRAEQEFTFDAFVEETELGRGYISEMERGMVVPSLATVARIAAALGMSVAELVAVDDTPLDELIDVARGLTDPQRRRLLREAKRMRDGGKAG
jgi:transcriptional regulator with XRE-family HTH domain